jgi:hypothetical protein
LNGIVHSVLDADGRLNAVATGTVTRFISGQGYVEQVAGTIAKPLMVTEAVAAADGWVGGFRYRADGALRLVDATAGLPAGARAKAGVMFSTTGQLCYTSDAVGSDVVRIDGVAITNDGRVYIALV